MCPSFLGTLVSQCPRVCPVSAHSYYQKSFSLSDKLYFHRDYGESGRREVFCLFVCFLLKFARSCQALI